MSITTATSFFKYQGQGIVPVGVKSISLHELIAGQGSKTLWLVWDDTSAYVGMQPGNLSLIDFVPLPADCVTVKPTGMDAYISTNYSGSYVAIVLHGSYADGLGYNGVSPPAMWLLLITSKDQINGNSATLYTKALSEVAFVNTPTGAALIEFSQPHQRPFDVVGYCGSTHPNSMFAMGIEAGAYVIKTGDLFLPSGMGSLCTADSLKLPTTPGGMDLYRSPWKVEEPNYSQTHDAYWRGRPVRVKLLGLGMPMSGYPKCAQITPFSWSSTSMGMAGHYKFLNTRLMNSPGGYYLELSSPSALIELETYAGYAIEYGVPPVLLNMPYVFGLREIVLGWDLTCEALTQTDPGSVTVGDGNIYGTPGFIVLSHDGLREVTGAVVGPFQVPTGSIHTLATGYAGNLKDPSATQGMTSTHLTNTGVVVAANGSLYHAMRIQDIDWDTPSFSFPDYNAGSGEDDNATMRFIGEGAGTGGLSPGWWVIKHHHVTGGETVLVILHSEDGTGWVEKYYMDIKSYLVGTRSDCLSADTSDYNFYVKASITDAMILVIIGVKVTTTSLDNVWAKVTILHTDAYTLDQFSTTTDLDVTEHEFMGTPITQSDNSPDVVLSTNMGNVKSYSHVDGASTTVWVPGRTFGAGELEKCQYSLAHGMVVNDITAAHLFATDSGPMVVGLHGANPGTPKAFRLSMEEPLLIPVVESLERYNSDDRGDTYNYPKYLVRFTHTSPRLGTLVFIGDAYSVTSDSGYFGPASGARHIMFSNMGAADTYKFPPSSATISSPTREEFSIISLGFTAIGGFEYLPDIPVSGSDPVYLVTDSGGEIRRLEVTYAPNYYQRLTPVWDSYAESYLLNFGGSGTFSAVPVTISALSSIAFYENEWAQLEADPLSVASVFSGSAYSTSTGGGFTIDDAADIFVDHEGWEIDLCAVITGSVYGDGMVLHIDTDTDKYLSVVATPNYVVFTLYSDEATETFTPTEASIAINVFDSKPHHFRLVFDGHFNAHFSVDGLTSDPLNISSTRSAWLASQFALVPAVIDTIGVFRKTTGGGYLSGSVEWLRITGFTTSVYPANLPPETLSLVPLGKPTADGDVTLGDVQSVSFPTYNSYFVGKNNLRITRSHGLWVATWCEGGSDPQPAGPLFMAYSQDLITWTTVVEGALKTIPSTGLISLDGPSAYNHLIGENTASSIFPTISGGVW